MVSAGSYILSTLALAALVLSLGFSTVRIRRRLLPRWEGPPARLVEAILGIALLIWLSELLGIFGLLYAWTLLTASVALAGAVAWRIRRAPLDKPSVPGGGAVGGRAPEEALATGRGGGSPAATGPGGWDAWAMLVTVGVIALVFAHWGLTIDKALSRGIFNFDSLWYHMPTAANIAQSHSVTGVHHTETVFTNWFYPQNSELLHAVGILSLTATPSLYSSTWAGWRSPFCLLGASAAPTAVARSASPRWRSCSSATRSSFASRERRRTTSRPPSPACRYRDPRNRLGDAREAGRGLPGAGLAARRRRPCRWPRRRDQVHGAGNGRGVDLAVLVLAPASRRWAAAAWWFLPALAGGGFWYLRNLIVAGNPMPVVKHLGPIDLPHPEGLESLRPDFNIAHYATDTGVWRDYFAPGLQDQLGVLWPLIVGGALFAAIVALARGRDPIVRWIGGIALGGMVVYVFMPLSAAGAEGAPDAFSINLRYVVPAMLAALAILPLPRAFDNDRRRAILLAALLLVLVLTDRSDAVLRDPSRVFALLLALCLVLIPAGLLLLRRRGASIATVALGFGALGLLIAAIGYPIERDYLRDRFANDMPAEERIRR